MRGRAGPGLPRPAPPRRGTARHGDAAGIGGQGDKALPASPASPCPGVPHPHSRTPPFRWRLPAPLPRRWHTHAPSATQLPPVPLTGPPCRDLPSLPSAPPQVTYLGDPCPPQYHPPHCPHLYHPPPTLTPSPTSWVTPSSNLTPGTPSPGTQGPPRAGSEHGPSVPVIPPSRWRVPWEKAKPPCLFPTGHLVQGEGDGAATSTWAEPLLHSTGGGRQVKSPPASVRASIFSILPSQLCSTPGAAAFAGRSLWRQGAACLLRCTPTHPQVPPVPQR